MSVKIYRCKKCRCQVPNALQEVCNLCFTKEEELKERRNENKLDSKENNIFESLLKNKP